MNLTHVGCLCLGMRLLGRRAGDSGCLHPTTCYHMFHRRNALWLSLCSLCRGGGSSEAMFCIFFVTFVCTAFCKKRKWIGHHQPV